MRADHVQALLAQPSDRPNYSCRSGARTQHLDRLYQRSRPEHDTQNTAPGSSSGGTPSTQFYAEQWASCLPATVTPMSNQWQTLKDQISAMTPSGNTNQAVGLAWGWQSPLSTTNPPIAAPA